MEGIKEPFPEMQKFIFTGKTWKFIFQIKNTKNIQVP